MLGESSKEIDRNIRCRILNLADIVSADPRKVSKLFLRKISVQSRCSQIRAKHIAQNNVHVKRSRPAAFGGHVVGLRPHSCADSIAYPDRRWEYTSVRSTNLSTAQSSDSLKFIN
jgi:hypothetical protein